MEANSKDEFMFPGEKENGLTPSPHGGSAALRAQVKLYLDTEFNGHGGELISIALAAEDGNHFYAVLPEPRTWNGWCFEHVFPHLNRAPEDGELVRFRLMEFMKARAGATIYADWPDDFAHLMKLMSGPSYEDSFLVPCSMVLLKESEPQPEVPHNALSDAIALMKWHNEPRGLSAAEDASSEGVTPKSREGL